MNSPYSILEISPSASQDEIKNAYRNLAKKFHPDLNPGNKNAEKKFKEINAAYELLGTPESRAKYDRGESLSFAEKERTGPFYHQTQQDGGRYSYSFGGIDDDILNSIFGNSEGPGRKFESADIPGQNTLYQMEIDFKDSVRGATREITLPNGKRLRVKIPAGINSGTKLRFAGQGEPGTGRGDPGDAYIEITVRPSKLFRKTGNDLEIEVPISITEAILGSEVKVPTMDGPVLLKIPPGVSSGNRIRISGKGVPNLGTGKQGDQYVVLKIVTPTQIDADFKQAIQSWSNRHSFDPRADWIGSHGELL